jgi:hypothetical protein
LPVADRSVRRAQDYSHCIPIADTIPPEIWITSPSDGSTVSGKVKIMFYSFDLKNVADWGWRCDSHRSVQVRCVCRLRAFQFAPPRAALVVYTAIGFAQNHSRK